MTSQRHSTCERSVRRSAGRVSDAVLLHAARESVLANGVRRSTLTDIARRADVSRMTLYRRFPDMRSVVTTLMGEEFAGILRKARAAEGRGTARQRLVAVTLEAVRSLRSDPLLLRVLDTDAEMLLPYLVQRLGSTQLAAERFVREYLHEGHADGSIRHGDPDTQTRVLVLTAQSFVLSSRPASTDVSPEDLVDELARHLDAALRPAGFPDAEEDR